MDIEKTLRAIAESQLRAEKRAELADKRADRADERADRFDERMDRAFERLELADKRADRADKRMDKFDVRLDRLEKKLTVTANLVRAGVKIVLERDKKFDYKLNALIDAQSRTDEKLTRFIEQWRRRSANGHN